MKRLLFILCLIAGLAHSENEDMNQCVHEGYTYGNIAYTDFMDAIDFECWAKIVIPDMVSATCEEAPYNDISNKFCKQSKKNDAKAKYKKKVFTRGLADLYKRLTWDCVKRAKIYKDFEDEAQEQFTDCLTDASINPSYSFQMDISRLIRDFIK